MKSIGDIGYEFISSGWLLHNPFFSLKAPSSVVYSVQYACPRHCNTMIEICGNKLNHSGANSVFLLVISVRILGQILKAIDFRQNGNTFHFQNGVAIAVVLYCLFRSFNFKCNCN